MSNETKHSCYILYNQQNLTYNGYSVNFSRRIRQHNSEIKGGARYTCNKGPWSYLLKIESDQLTKKTAMSLEWSIKYPTNKRPRPKLYAGASGRINSIPLVLRNPKFANIPMRIQVIEEYFDILCNLCIEFTNVEISIL